MCGTSDVLAQLAPFVCNCGCNNDGNYIIDNGTVQCGSCYKFVATYNRYYIVTFYCQVCLTDLNPGESYNTCEICTNSLDLSESE
jgi:hypothetical protein